MFFGEIPVFYLCPHCGGHCPGGTKILATGLSKANHKFIVILTKNINYRITKKYKKFKITKKVFQYQNYTFRL